MNSVTLRGFIPTGIWMHLMLVNWHFHVDWNIKSFFWLTSKLFPPLHPPPLEALEMKCKYFRNLNFSNLEFMNEK